MITTMENRRVRGDGGAREGALIYIDDVLLAVMSRLTGEDVTDHDQIGCWFLEAGLGPCGVLFHPEQQIFGDLDAASAWIIATTEADDRGEVR